jgi:hypothetical protein
MNPFLNRVLGGSQVALGAMSGNPQLLRAGVNRFGPQPSPPPTGNVLQYNPNGPSMPVSTPPIISPDTGGGDLPRPTLYRPGEKPQIDITGTGFNLPGRKMPQEMYTE